VDEQRRQLRGLITLAQNNVAAGWINDGVGVLNLFYTDGRKAQDQLTYTQVANLPPPPSQPTPEPATLLLMGVGGLVLGSRKRLRRSRRPRRRDGSPISPQRAELSA